MNFQQFKQSYQQRVEQQLDYYLPAINRLPQRLHQAMRYSVFNGGKRIRPLLVYASGLAGGANPTLLDRPACAVELIHSYSLVHDDLPAMDDDQLRRGKPTCHIQYDEATAILVGDALQTLAFELLAQEQPDLQAEQRLRMITTLAQASGSHGMVGGQVLDIEAIGQSLNLAQLETMHIHKTGALIRASVQLGAIAADIDAIKMEQLDHYAKALGLAFQVQDDILDVIGSTQSLGKTQGKDRQQNKPSYVELLGLQEAKQEAKRLVQEALQALSSFDQRAEPLRAIAQYIIERQH